MEVHHPHHFPAILLYSVEFGFRILGKARHHYSLDLPNILTNPCECRLPRGK